MTVHDVQERPIIQIESVRKTYRKGDVEVTPLDDADLRVRAGEFLVLMGPSGSGKSTLLNLVAGIDKPTAGRVIVDGQAITAWSESQLTVWRRRAIGYIFQQFNLMPVLTAYENVELPLLLLPVSRQKRRQLVATALELVGLSDRADHYPRQLSGGQEQRVAIAQSLATDPKIILADEPTGALDRDSAATVLDLLRQLNQKFNKTVVMVTHDHHAAEFATRLLHLEKGRFVDAPNGSTSAKTEARDHSEADLRPEEVAR
jgi:putative ABC transport system ATP-binding protein